MLFITVYNIIHMYTLVNTSTLYLIVFIRRTITVHDFSPRSDNMERKDNLSQDPRTIKITARLQNVFGNASPTRCLILTYSNNKEEAADSILINCGIAELIRINELCEFSACLDRTDAVAIYRCN